MAVYQHPLPCPMFFTGLSTDTKPTLTVGPVGQQVPNGAVFYATDTAAWFIYNLNSGWTASTQSMV